MKQERPRTFWCWLGRTSQIGFAMVLPVVVCTVAASWLSRRYALGGWAVFTGLALGLCGAAAAFVKIVRPFLRAASRDKEE